MDTTAGLRFCMPYCGRRRSSLNGRLKDGQDILLRLSWEPGEPCGPNADPDTSLSFNQDLRARRAKKLQREQSAHQDRAIKRVHQSQRDKPPPDTEEILYAKNSPGQVFT